MVRTLPCHGRGREFEPRRSRQQRKVAEKRPFLLRKERAERATVGREPEDKKCSGGAFFDEGCRLLNEARRKPSRI